MQKERSSESPLCEHAIFPVSKHIFNNKLYYWYVLPIYSLPIIIFIKTFRGFSILGPFSLVIK